MPLMDPQVCSCCRIPALPPGMNRRQFFRFSSGSAVALAFHSARAQAQSTAKPYAAMLLSCVDPRTQRPVAQWMDSAIAQSHTESLSGRYSAFTIAGAAVGVIAPRFRAWRETFWENFSASVELHRISNLIVVDHANCGALGLAYGPEVLHNPKLELEAHMVDVTELKRELAIRHPRSSFQAWYLARDEMGRFVEWKCLIPGSVIG